MEARSRSVLGQEVGTYETLWSSWVFMHTVVMYAVAVLLWVPFNFFLTPKPPRSPWSVLRACLCLDHQVIPRRSEDLAEWMRSWIRRALPAVRRRLRCRSCESHLVSEAIEIVRRSMHDDDGIQVIWGLGSAVQLIPDARHRRVRVSINRLTYRPLFWVLLHETEHVRYALRHESERQVDDLLLRDALDMIGAWERAWIEFRVHLRTNPYLHLLCPFYVFEVSTALLFYLVLALPGALRRGIQQLRRRFWCLARGHERLRARWR